MELTQELPKLPARLIRFFEKYPPQLYSAKYTGVILPLTRRDAKLARIAEAACNKQKNLSLQQEAQSSSDSEFPAPIPTLTPSQSNSDPPIPTASITNSSPPSISPTQPSPPTQFPPNPFLPYLNPETNRWAGARIGLRQQADLIKLAKQHSIESLLPPSRKSTAFKEARILTRGSRVKGTGVGQKVKGHKWERAIPALLQKRKEAMEGMPALVREWERRGHGRGWKQWPKAKTR